jgi:alkylhydroperoxidase family enzyme
MARVPLLEKSQVDPKMREFYDKLEANGHQVLNIYKAVANAPKLAPEFFRLGNRILFQTALAPNLRELAILRVGDLAKAPYEVTKHVEIGLKSGLSAGQIQAIPNWESAKVFDEQERAVLRFTDEVSRGIRASDAAFAALRVFLNDQQIVELTVTIGFYEMICRVLEALQVENEDEAFKPF